MRWMVVVAALFVGCTCKKAPPPKDEPPVPPPTGLATGSAAGSATKSLSPADVEGYWSGDWGHTVFREKNGMLLAAYNHDEGTIVGTLVGNKLIGWWCEVPNRRPDHDAGDVELTFITDANGKRKIDGRWRYGSTGEWHEDWDVTFDVGKPDDVLVKRFDDPNAFCLKPSSP